MLRELSNDRLKELRLVAVQALKGIEDSPVAERFLENMSPRGRAEVEQEISALPEVDPDQRAGVHRAILVRTMRKADEGEIIWPTEKDDLVELVF